VRNRGRTGDIIKGVGGIDQHPLPLLRACRAQVARIGAVANPPARAAVCLPGLAAFLYCSQQLSTLFSQLCPGSASLELAQFPYIVPQTPSRRPRALLVSPRRTATGHPWGCPISPPASIRTPHLIITDTPYHGRPSRRNTDYTCITLGPLTQHKQTTMPTDH
jgi:hypothetical protein